MMNILTAYAKLLVNYCLEIKPNEKLFIQTTTLAAPLVKEVYKEAILQGAIVSTDFEIEEQEQLLLLHGNAQQWAHVSTAYKEAMEHFDAYLYIRAPYQGLLVQPPSESALQQRRAALAPWQKLYFDRIGTRSLKRCLCQYPTAAAADQAGMSLKAYEKFVYAACRLYDEQPAEAWLEVRRFQQQIVDFLNTKTEIRYEGEGTNITFSTQGRTWINSDGRNNMPSGEVYTSPVEDSVNGHIHFTFPAILFGELIEGVTLWVKDGWIEKWDAHIGKPVLDRAFAIEGARRFGEAAIATNYNISKFTKNILFDEKIGGTIHMAIGQSYLQCGGKNESAIHYDMIANMLNGGRIYADGVKIYENGYFLYFS